MRGRTTVWPLLVDGGRWVKWRGSNPRANQHTLDQKSVIGAVDSVQDPKILHLFRVDSPEPLLRITKDRSIQFDGTVPGIGPDASQLQLKETLLNNQRGFQRVIVRAIPYEYFATSDEARAYFSKLTEVTVAPPKRQQGSIQFVFPFSEQRDHHALREVYFQNKQRVLDFDGTEFVGPGKHSSDIFYSTPFTRNLPYPYATPLAPVRYKSVRFDASQNKEVYDPFLREILVFSSQSLLYPWLDPDEEDIRRMKELKNR